MIKRGHSCVYRECVIVARSYINKILAKVDVVMEASAPCIREGGDQIGHWLGGGSGPLGLATADQEFSLIKYFTFRCHS